MATYDTKLRPSGVPRLMVKLPFEDPTPSPPDDVITVKQFIKNAFSDATVETDLFATALNRQIYEDWLGGGYIARNGYIEHGAPAEGATIYVMSRFRPLDLDTDPPSHVPPSAAEIIAYGIPIDSSVSRHYVDGLDLEFLYIYVTDPTNMFLQIDIAFGHSRG